MRILFRIFVSSFFLPLFLIFLFLTSLQFQLLNYDFVTKSFRTHNVYSQFPGFFSAAISERAGQLDIEEEESYKKIASLVPPILIQQIVERNLKEVLLFVHGETKDIVFFLPTTQLGLELGWGEDSEVRLSSVGGGEMLRRIEIVNGMGKIIRVAWFAVLVLLFVILFIQYKLGGNKKSKGLGYVLLSDGILVVVLGLLLRFLFVQMARDLVISPEPSQIILGILAGSLFPEIVNTWIIISGCLSVLGLGLLIWKRN